MNRYLRIALVFGAVAAAMNVLYILVMQYWVGENALTRVSSVDILITLLCILYAMGYYRDRKQGGVLHFWQGAIIGIETAFIGTLLTCLVLYVLIRFADPAVFTDFIQITREDMQRRLVSDAFSKNPNLRQMLNSQLASLPEITPFNMVFFPGGVFVKNVGIEVLVTGMIAAIMRKNVAHLSGQSAKDKK